MALTYLVVLQAAAAAPPPAPSGAAAPLPAVEFDLRNLPRPSGCAGAAPEEILVCGRRDDSAHRLGEPLPDEASLALPEAEARLFGNVSGRIYLEQVELQQGLQSKRVMFGIRLPF